MIKYLLQRVANRLGYRIDRARKSVVFDWPRISRLENSTADRLVTDVSVANDSVELAAVKSHLLNLPMPTGLPSLGERWGAYATRLRAHLQSVRSIEELLAYAQDPAAGVETHLVSPELNGFCHWTELQMLDNLPAELYGARTSFRSPPMTPEIRTLEAAGRRIDYVSLCASNDILTILHWLGSVRPRSVCDIGGGTGKYAHAWLTNSAYRPELLVIVDIPETLIYSEALLRTVFDESTIQYIDSPTAVPRQSGIILCPIGNVAALAGTTFDLVMNVGSMQEMTDHWIDWYMDWLDRQPCRFFYSWNYFANALDNMREGHNSWSPRPSSRWSLMQSRMSLGMRNVVHLLYHKDEAGAAGSLAIDRKGADGWLQHLERVRIRGDEVSLRLALNFAQTDLPFLPKEIWEVARRLARLTGSSADEESFRSLDAVRGSGNEAAR